MGTCVNCECTGALAGGVQVATPELRMLVSAPAGQLAAILTEVAAGLGLLVDQLAPGLWELRGDQLSAAVSALREATTTVEAEQIRVVVHEGDADDRELVAAAMAAPTLDQLDAQSRGAQLRQLFADEQFAFRSAYQPIVELPSQRTVAFEALLRARTAEGAELPPAPLFDQAQRAGWSPRLDRIGRTTALHGASGWLGDRSLFVNFIPTSIYDPKVCLQTTERAARRAGIPLEQVVFEVTESERVTDVAHLERIFTYYRARGCRVALDDLGAGYSSLELLVRLKPDVVKLDRTLIERLPEPTSTAVVRAVIEITHTYGGLVLAEGVETVTQSDAVNALGVDLGQGWLYGRPSFPGALAAA